MKTPVNVAITGAAGQIGYALAFRVASGQMLGADQPVNLHLLEITPALGALQGVVMELNDCAFPTLNRIVATDDAHIRVFHLSSDQHVTELFPGSTNQDTFRPKNKKLVVSWETTAPGGPEHLVVYAAKTELTNVAKGEVLFTVDARAARATLDQAAAAINEARASIAEASAAQKTAREQLALYRNLSDPAAVSRAEVIRAEGEEAAATSRLGLARARLAASQSAAAAARTAGGGRGQGTAQGKIEALQAAGIEVAATPADMADALLRRMKRG